MRFEEKCAEKGTFQKKNLSHYIKSEITSIDITLRS